MSHSPRPEPLSEHHWQEVLKQMTEQFTISEILRGLSQVYWDSRDGEGDRGNWFDYLARQLSETAEAIDEQWNADEQLP